jgi:hypothetical protein
MVIFAVLACVYTPLHLIPTVLFIALFAAEPKGVESRKTAVLTRLHELGSIGVS